MEKTGIIMNRVDMMSIFERYDASGDGELDYKEFSDMFLGDNVEKEELDDPYLKEKAMREKIAAS